LTKLTAEIARERWDYDPKTGVLRWKIKLSNVKVGDVTGYESNGGYLQVGWDGKIYLAHRIIWLIVHGEWPPEQLDHINGDRTDNRLVNLRCVSNRQNSLNKERHRKGNLQGAYRLNRNLKSPWKAIIQIDGERKHLGYFPTEQQAHEAYLAALNNISTDQGD
jgi:hypothetical protein